MIKKFVNYCIQLKRQYEINNIKRLYLLYRLQKRNKQLQEFIDGTRKEYPPAFNEKEIYKDDEYRRWLESNG